MTYFPVLPFAAGHRRAGLRQEGKRLVRILPHRLGLDYGRQFYSVEKPVEGL